MLFATVVAPFIAAFLAAVLTAWFTLMWQDRKEKRDAKLRVFTSLMGLRQGMNNFQVALEWAKTVNVIDVIFSNSPKVLQAWHEYFAMLQQPQPLPGQAHKHIELYSAMARDLGFSELSQTTIDQVYSPRAVEDAITKANELQAELLRVLKNTQSLTVEPRPNAMAAGMVPLPPGSGR